MKGHGILFYSINMAFTHKSKTFVFLTSQSAISFNLLPFNHVEMLLFGSHYLSLFTPIYLFIFGQLLGQLKPKGGFQSCLEIRQVPKCSYNCFTNVENNFFFTKTLTSPDNLPKWPYCLLVRTFLTLKTNQNNFHLEFTSLK